LPDGGRALVVGHSPTNEADPRPHRRDRGAAREGRRRARRRRRPTHL
jgi:hypothetical protein